jgi:hypothetical protein
MAGAGAGSSAGSEWGGNCADDRHTGGNGEVGGEEETTADPGFAFHPHAALHHLDKPPRYGKPEPRAAVFTRSGSVNLAEGFKNELLLIGGNADTRVTHHES